MSVSIAQQIRARNDRIEHLYREGMSMRDVGLAVGMSAAGVNTVLSKLGIARRPRYVRKADPRLVRLAYASGLTMQQVARQFCISPASVCYCVNGRPDRQKTSRSAA